MLRDFLVKIASDFDTSSAGEAIQEHLSAKDFRSLRKLDSAHKTVLRNEKNVSAVEDKRRNQIKNMARSALDGVIIGTVGALPVVALGAGINAASSTLTGKLLGAGLAIAPPLIGAGAGAAFGYTRKKQLEDAEKTRDRAVNRLRLLVEENPQLIKSMKDLKEGYIDFNNFRSLNKQAELKTELKPHQKRVVDRILREDQPGLVVAHGLGSGKTLTSIAAQDALGLDADVIVPAALKDNYIKEQQKHLRKGNLNTNLETIQKLTRQGVGSTKPLLILDEAHKVRESASKGYKSLAESTANKRLLLTASPFYNRPSDIAPLINLASNKAILPSSQKEFDSKYIIEQNVNPNFMMWLRGVKGGTTKKINPNRARELQTIFNKFVDHHPGSTEGFPKVEEVTYEVPMTNSQFVKYKGVEDQAPFWLRMKVRAGLPLDKKESSKLNAFAGAQRQIALSTAAYTKGEAQSPKIDLAVNNLKSSLKEDKDFKAVVYSNYLKSGIEEYKKRLDQEKIPYGVFAGDIPHKKRDQIIKDYNSGKIKTLLLSSAGGEGLDLKGTRSIQVLEPHWNEEKLKQVKGRGIRYGSHAHLPVEKQNVRIENYISTLPVAGKLQQVADYLTTGTTKHKSIDEYLTSMSKGKEQLLNQFRHLMPNSSVNNIEKKFDNHVNIKDGIEVKG